MLRVHSVREINAPFVSVDMFRLQLENAEVVQRNELLVLVGRCCKSSERSPNIQIYSVFRWNHAMFDDDENFIDSHPNDIDAQDFRSRHSSIALPSLIMIRSLD